MKFLVLNDSEWNCYSLLNIVEFRGLELNCESGFQFMLPKSIKKLCMGICETNRTSLCQLFYFGDVANLVEIEMSNCDGIKHLFDPSIFPRLEILNLSYLSDLRGLVCTERSSATLPLPAGSFSTLKMLFVHSCPRVKNLHGLSDVSILPNLEEIHIVECDEFEEIFSDTSVISLPKLRELGLAVLPKLKKGISFKVDQSPLDIIVNDCPCVKKLSVWSSSSIFLNLKKMIIVGCDELEEIVFYNAPKMEMLHLAALPKLKSIPFKAESLRQILVLACPMVEKIALFEKDSSYPQSLELAVIENRAWPSRESISSFFTTDNDLHIEQFITEEIPAREELHKLAESEYYKKLEKLPVDQRVQLAFGIYRHCGSNNEDLASSGSKEDSS